MQHDEHVISYYGLCTEVYTDAADIGISVAHIAEWTLERWWQSWAVAYRVSRTDVGVVMVRPANDCCGIDLLAALS